MSGELATGVFALAGTLVGGFATYAATSRDVRARRAEATTQRASDLNELRHTQYSALVTKCDVLTDATREVASYEVVNDVPAESYNRYIACWEDFVAANAAVAVAGPSEASNAAQTLYRTVADICNVVDTWYQTEDAPWPAEKFRELVDRRTALRRDFLDVARAVVADDTISEPVRTSRPGWLRSLVVAAGYFLVVGLTILASYLSEAGNIAGGHRTDFRSPFVFSEILTFPLSALNRDWSGYPQHASKIAAAHALRDGLENVLLNAFVEALCIGLIMSVVITLRAARRDGESGEASRGVPNTLGT